MSAFGTVLLVLGLVAVAGTAIVAVLVWRRVQVIRRGGVEVSVRVPPDGPVENWHTGVARYQGHEFVWLRLSGLGTQPNEVLDRRRSAVVERRKPEGAERDALPDGVTVLRFRRPDGDIEYAMEPGVLTGFLSWLESAPPGSAVRRAS